MAAIIGTIALKAEVKTLLWALQAERGEKRLQFLLKQAEVFQHFAPDAAEEKGPKK